MSARTDSELQEHRKLAEQLAAKRKERVTSAHLLAAIASRPTSARDLLTERQLDAERLLRAARASTDDERDPLRRAIDRSRDVAARMGSRDPLAVHLLIALMSDRRCAAHRALDQCGIDVNRLRVAAMNIGLGLVGRRRIVTRRDSNLEVRERQRSRLGRAVKVPLFPPAPQRSPRTTESDGAEGGSSPKPGGLPPKTPAQAPAAAKAAVPPRSSQPSTRRVSKKASGRFALDPKRFPTLTALGRNLTLEAEQGDLDPVIGRDVEVEQVLDVLAKRHGNNPCLVGVAGVGKTAVVRALAMRIATDPRTGALDDRIVIEIPASEFIAGTGVRGALAERVGALRKEVSRAGGRVVLFFDEIHQLFLADGAEELTGELKLALGRGELPCIGATTHDEYRRAIDADPALARRFSPVEVVELGKEDAFLVLDALAPAFEQHHGVRYSEQSLAASVGWTVRYMPGRALPDKAISVIDLAGARLSRRGGDEVTPQEVAEVVAEIVDMPVERLLETDGERMLRLEQLLGDRVVGHSEELASIARILRRNAVGLGGRRPIGTFLLLGPTGVGKTETAKAIAEILFFSERAMTRVDMSEYGESHSTARLIGAPPGYVGHDAGGQLTEAVRRRPYQVLLLDEIEKAHPEVLETFLAVFDEGRLTDGKGRTVDFSNTVILLTSNIGADVSGAGPRRPVGFASGEGRRAREVEGAVIARARATLAPEFFNRLDEVLVFKPLRREDVREIARRLLRSTTSALEVERGLRLVFDDAVVEHLLDAGGFEASLGARPMRRTIGRLIEAPLAEQILRGDIGEGDTVRFRVRAGGIVLDRERLAAPAAE